MQIITAQVTSRVEELPIGSTVSPAIMLCRWIIGERQEKYGTLIFCYRLEPHAEQIVHCPYAGDLTPAKFAACLRAIADKIAPR